MNLTKKWTYNIIFKNEGKSFMNIFQDQDKIMLYSRGNLKGLVSDGKHYFLINRTNQCIIKLDLNFQEVKQIPLSVLYDSICYDQQLKCFWAIKKRCLSIFQLTLEFIELQQIPIYSTRNYPEYFSSISYDSIQNKLIINFKSFIGCINKNYFQEVQPLLFLHDLKCDYTVIISQFLFTKISENNYQYLKIFNLAGRNVYCLEIPYQYKLLDFVIDYQNSDEIKKTILMLCNNNVNEYFIIKHQIMINCLEEINPKFSHKDCCYISYDKCCPRKCNCDIDGGVF